MDIQALIQQKLQSKELSKAAKAGSKKTSIPLNKITDPSALGSGAIASIMDSGDNVKVVDAAKDRVEETLFKVKSGNLEDLEAILVNQVYVLNGLFNQLVIQGKASLTKPAVLKSLPNHPKTMLNVAMKAQTQCRATIQTISDLKNPKKTTFIKNQLNNVKMELEERIEQLEDIENGSKKLDYRTEATAISINSEMEALEVIDRSKDPRR
ncbi:MAG: hypothetical protein QNJ34_15900 [Xenococcaceae cyanobacterium MO_188.B29]|nr:hypothetical protein [Xenococcaceae cyanobacterium MO_188.B29]